MEAGLESMMRALVILLFATLPIVTSAAICGTDSSSQEPVARIPEGETSKLRVEVVPPEIECGKTAEVQIWLDDLPTDPPVDAEGGSYRSTGLNGFTFILKYDSNVVRYDEAIGATLPLRLDRIAPQTDARFWQLDTPYRDASAGELLVGGVDLGIDLNDPDIRAEDPTALAAVSAPQSGIHPVSEGSPVQLAAIGIIAVGAGSTELSMLGFGGDVELVNAQGALYSTPEVVSGSLTVRGECVAAVLPTSTPWATPTPRRISITTPNPRDPPYPLPTAEVGCEWAVSERSEGDPSVYALTSTCYPGYFIFDETAGSLRPSRGGY